MVGLLLGALVIYTVGSTPTTSASERLAAADEATETYDITWLDGYPTKIDRGPNPTATGIAPTLAHPAAAAGGGTRKMGRPSGRRL